MQQNNSGFFNSIPPVTRNLILINLIFWLAQITLPKIEFSVEEYLGLFSINTGFFKPHQLITYMFLHDTKYFFHLFFNMFAVFMFGRTLETALGGKKFLTYYILTGIGAGLTQLLISYITGMPSFTVGASGAVFGILVAFGMMFPNVKLILIPIPIPVKAKWFVIGYGLLELFSGIADNPNDNVAHFAHLGGLVTGAIIMLIWKRKARGNGSIY